jgi:hypothetical protein
VPPVASETICVCPLVPLRLKGRSGGEGDATPHKSKGQRAQMQPTPRAAHLQSHGVGEGDSVCPLSSTCSLWSARPSDRLGMRSHAKDTQWAKLGVSESRRCDPHKSNGQRAQMQHTPCAEHVRNHGVGESDSVPPEQYVRPLVCETKRQVGDAIPCRRYPMGRTQREREQQRVPPVACETICVCPLLSLRPRGRLQERGGGVRTPHIQWPAGPDATHPMCKACAEPLCEQERQRVPLVACETISVWPLVAFETQKLPAGGGMRSTQVQWPPGPDAAHSMCKTQGTRRSNSVCTSWPARPQAARMGCDVHGMRSQHNSLFASVQRGGASISRGRYRLASGPEDDFPGRLAKPRLAKPPIPKGTVNREVTCEMPHHWGAEVPRAASQHPAVVQSAAFLEQASGEKPAPGVVSAVGLELAAGMEPAASGCTCLWLRRSVWYHR